MHIHKKLQTALCALLCVCLLGTLPVFAETPTLSPALRIIANNLRLSKSSLAGTEINFSADDFDWAVGAKVKSVTFSSLPQKEDGSLYLGVYALSEGQTVSRKALSSLFFSPASLSEKECGFSAQVNTDSGSYALQCSLFMLREINLAPSASMAGSTYLKVSTHCGIPYYGTLRADDPENDTLTYRITRYPSKGLLTLTDAIHGSYTYSPAANASGRDSFSYEAIDRYGNRSEEVKVRITIDKSAKNVFFSDMDGHWAHNAAITVSQAGLMSGRTENGRLCFSPDEPVTRSEFLMLAMNAAGYTVLGSSVSTGFLDDSEIPSAHKGYVAAALERGFIRGSATDAGSVFLPDSPITRAEAAVMIQNILGLSSSRLVSVFADSDAVPAWASGALTVMNEAGILRGSADGTISPARTLDRAQTAQILCGILAAQKR